MRTPLNTLIKLLFVSAMAIGITACHSSKKVVKGNDGVSVQKVDYGAMKSDVESRDYDLPAIGALIEEAVRWLGVPYKYGGNDKHGVDCSGLTSQVFLKSLNVKMPRTSREQQQWCDNIKKDNLLPGDLVFFATGSNRNRVSHVGIYIGNGDIIHASSSRGVIVSSLGETYYMKRYHSSGRPAVIQEIYASSGKKKKSKKSKAKNEPIPADAVNDNVSPSPVVVPSISIDQLIEMQVDSIAAAIDENEPAPSPTPSVPQRSAKPSSKPSPKSPKSPKQPSPAQPSQSPSSTQSPSSPAPSPTQSPAPIPPKPVIEEPNDSVFNQFFD